MPTETAVLVEIDPFDTWLRDFDETDPANWVMDSEGEYRGVEHPPLPFIEGTDDEF